MSEGWWGGGWGAGEGSVGIPGKERGPRGRLEAAPVDGGEQGRELWDPSGPHSLFTFLSHKVSVCEMGTTNNLPTRWLRR